MRKILFFVFLTAFMNGSFAQTWPMPGAHWEYCRGGVGLDFRIFEYTRDTLINSVNYQVIERINASVSPDPGAVYTRYSNDTVYRYVNNQDYPLFIFNAQVGDLYTTFRTDYNVFADSSCRSILPVSIFHADTLTYGSLVLKGWDLSDTLFDDIYTGYSPGSTWKLVERIGLINDFPFTLNIWSPISGCNFPTDVGGGFVLQFYSDSSYSYFTQYGSYCDVGVQETTAQETIKLFPNPANDILNLNYDLTNQFISTDKIDFIVSDLSGKELIRKTIPANQLQMQISVSGLATGMYFCRIETENEMVYSRKFSVVRD